MVARILLSSSLILSMLLTTFAQQPTPPPKPTPPAQEKPPEIDSQDVVRITTNLVQIDAVVTKDGKAITDLQPEDFEILEDGKARAITHFSYISNIPGTPPISSAAAKASGISAARDRTAPPILPAKINLNDQRRIVALVVDDLGISRESMPQVRKDVQKLVDEASPNDLIAIIRTGGDVGTLQQFTNDKRVLQAAVERVRWNPCSRVGLAVFARVGPMNEAFNSGGCSAGTLRSTLHVLRFIVQGMGLIPGRKSLIFLSDHLPIRDDQPSVLDETKAVLGSVKSNTVDLLNTDAAVASEYLNHATPLEQIAEFANRASVVIYAVDTRGLQFTGMTAGDNVRLSSRTINSNPQSSIMKARDTRMRDGSRGSEMIAERTGGFLIKNSNNFNLQKIMDDQNGYYLIGFSPAEETFDRQFHHLKLRLKRGGFTVRTREGFYGFTSEQSRPALLSTTDAMNKALGSPFGAKDLSMRLTTFFIDEGRGPMLRSFLHLDPRDLTFSDQPDGLRAANIEIKAMLFGDNGMVIQEANQRGSIGIAPPTYDRSLREGVIYSFDLPTRAGGIQFRVAVRDVATGRIGSAGQFVDIPNLQSGVLAMSGIVIRERDATGSPATTPSDDVRTGPAVRRFHQNSTVDIGYMIYNANQASQLTAQARLYHDGKMILSPDPMAVSMKGQIDPRRITNRGNLHLGFDLVPGDYVFQIIVTDAADKQKPRVASQWIDFEIVK